MRQNNDKNNWLGLVLLSVDLEHNGVLAYMCLPGHEAHKVGLGHG